MNIISCSRRTDIPAFYYDWLQERLKEKTVTLVNGYNSQEYTIDLDPDNVHSIVLWSKNYKNLIKDAGLLKDYNLYFQFTINCYSKYLEPNVPSYNELVDQVGELCSIYSPEQVSWRFDPIILCEKGENDVLSPWDSRLNMFNDLCEEFSVFGLNRCTFSFVSLYGKVKEVFDHLGVEFRDLSDEGKISFTKEMLEIADPLGIKLYICSDALIENVEGINKSHCVDGNALVNLFGGKVSLAKDSRQRKACGCSKSSDIGSYSQNCFNKCLYCYANPTDYTIE